MEPWKLYIPVGCRKGEDGEAELLPLLDSLGHTKTTNFFSRTFKINKILLPCSSRVYRGVLGQIIVDEASDNRDDSNEMIGAPSSSIASIPLFDRAPVLKRLGARKCMCMRACTGV